MRGNNRVRNHVLSLALPIVFEQIAILLLGIINTIMVGRLGKEAVAAVGNVDMISRCIFPLFAGLATGGTILIAHSIGKEHKEEACDIAKQALYSGIILSIVVTIVLLITRNPILHLLFGDVEASVMNLAKPYFKITILSYPFMFIYYVANGVMRGSGETKTPLKVTIIMNIVSAVLSYFFIYGLNMHVIGIDIDLAGLGVKGAAIGITVARACGALINVFILLKGKRRIRILQWKKWNIRFDIFSKILRLGIPYGMEQFAMQTGKLMLQVLITGMGTVAIAANTLGMSIMSLCITLGYGFNLAAVTLTGQSIGAGKPEEANTYTKEILKINLFTLSCISILIIIFVPHLLSIYTNDKEVIACGTTIIRIYALSQPFLAIVQVLTGSLRGAGDTKYPMFTTLIGVWFFRVLFGYILGVLFDLGINGIWIAMNIDLIIRAILYMIRYRKGGWRKIWIEENI
ncbi:MAG: efflux family protein [Clostridiales bacterium]|jgi:putative MATE family efflux protein|nr:efflux family protein [Clostridiales bacterium]